MTDARIVRTRASLHRAILELATDKPVTAITVSELAAHAGINRVTFYKHFSTPGEALGSALALEFDPSRDEFVSAYEFASMSPAELFRSTVLGVLDHIERRRDLYLLAVNTPQEGTVPSLIADHVTEALSRYLAQRAQLEPPLPDFDLDTVARYLAGGLVGALKAWLLSGSQDRERFMQSIEAVAPSWLFPEEGQPQAD